MGYTPTTYTTAVSAAQLNKGEVGIQTAAADIYNVKDPAYGAAGNGVIDDSAAIQAAITAAANAGGGTIYFPPGTYLLATQLTIPVPLTAGAYGQQRSIRLSGAQSYAQGQAFTPAGGAILDMRSTTAPGKIFTRGIGLLEVDHLTFRNESTDATPFIYTTGTTLRVHDNSFNGSSAKAQTQCDQDAIVLGGTSTTGGTTSSAPFQGYGSVIENNHFSRIRRAVFGQVFANAVTIANNWIDHNCGTNLAAGAAIEFAGDVTNACTGNLIHANQIEMLGYPYGIKLSNAVGNSLLFNGFYDPGNGAGTQATVLAAHRCDTTATSNLIMPGFVGAPMSALSDAPANNSILTGNQVVSLLRNGLTIYGAFRAKQAAIMEGGNGGFTVQPEANVSNEGFPIHTAKRSAAQTTNANANGLLWELYNGGTVFMGNLNGAVLGTPSGGGYMYVQAGALKWKGSSGTITTIAAA